MTKSSSRNEDLRTGGWWKRWRRRRADHATASDDSVAQDRPVLGRFRRRELLTGLAATPLIGTMLMAALKRCGWESYEERCLGAELDSAAGTEVDATTRPSKTFQWARLEDRKGKVPHGQIGKLKLSRMILGGNLIGGWAHARDLIYVSKLVKAYHHRLKIFETFRLAEACGVNTIVGNPIMCETMNDYWENGDGKIQFISDCGGNDLLEMTQKSIDHGACACYIQGGVADDLVAKGQFDPIARCLELTRKNGLPAGIGAHKLATVRACVEQGFEPDFWMKTLHHGDYWSAKHPEQNDNIWCEEPEETIAFMKDLPQPWIAFKVLGAGAIHPKVGFQYAFEGGADFICVGMYDFQVVEDANIALDLLGGKLERQRPWHG